MSYCINPNCSNRINSDDCEFCQACGTKLLINERYQIVKALRVGLNYNSEVFEVKDFKERANLKVLKSLSPKFNNSKAADLFEKEAQILIWLSADWHKHRGIPKVKPDSYFSCTIGNSLKQLNCLVMEKIEGQNLEQWLNENQCISEEQAINWLQQLIHILDKVHQQGLWHRDIKPSNIMLQPDGQLVLIDFGAVGIGCTIIASNGYTPPEQIEGATVLQSDLFALGRTFVYLLTGKHPYEFPIEQIKNETALQSGNFAVTKSFVDLFRSKPAQELPLLITKKLIWQSETSKVSDQLANLIDDLMAYLPENRPKNTQELLQRLQAIEQSNSTVTYTPDVTTLINSGHTKITTTSNKQKPQNQLNIFKLGGVIVIVGLAFTATNHLVSWHTSNFKNCSPINADNLSYGEEILVPGSKTTEKWAAVKAISGCNYAKAVKLFEQSRASQRNDPETLIYLNNAKINYQKLPYYTIAIVAPLSGNHDNINSGLEILRGVAQAQNEFNQIKPNKRIRLKVLIANDKNDLEQGKKLAEVLGENAEILAVIGHATSDITIAAAEIYKQNQLVLISPTSTSDELSTKSSTEANFLFRTVSSDRVTAQALTSYLLNSARQQKAAVFYNSNSSYSSSLRNQFITDFSASGGSTVEFDLSTFLFSANQNIDKIQKQGRSALVLFPDSTTRNKAVEVIKANSPRYLMVGGDSVYNSDILKMGAQDALGLVVATPWHNLSSSNREFPQAAQKLWGGAVSWRTAFAYDATRSLITALEKTPNPSRNLLQKTLSDPNFIATGATGNIQFRANGDRKNAQMQFVKVENNSQGKPVFVPLKKLP
ncbi:MAG: bifunctional serine/threonine-protein kinase/ABC transporter substrate-binding protein [Coleofasciculaceae cyanobacterium]